MSKKQLEQLEELDIQYQQLQQQEEKVKVKVTVKPVKPTKKKPVKPVKPASITSSDKKLKAAWFKNPHVNPHSGRTITIGGPTYKTLEKQYGTPNAPPPAPKVPRKHKGRDVNTYGTLSVARYVPSATERETYKAIMTPHIFEMVEDYNQKAQAHQQGELREVNKALKFLRKELISTFNWESSMYLRVKEDNMRDMRFMIVGPRDTPYQNGLLIFRMSLPGSYPVNPPRVKLLNTLGHRLNPNLYACGKVCLSLLGTWAGPGWTPKNTLMDILLALQSFVLNMHPVQNEPGFEKTPKAISLAYNTVLRLGVIRATMIAPLKRPPTYFSEAIHDHFLIKRDEILAELHVWTEEALALDIDITQEIPFTNNIMGRHGLEGFKEAFVQAASELTELLLKLN